MPGRRSVLPTTQRLLGDCDAWPTKFSESTEKMWSENLESRAPDARYLVGGTARVGGAGGALSVAGAFVGVKLPPNSFDHKLVNDMEPPRRGFYLLQYGRANKGKELGAGD